MTIKGQSLVLRDITEAIRSGVEASGFLRDGEIRWPSNRYQRDPVGFARDVLGLTMWDRQEEILNAYRDHPRVAVASGHKIGKSTSGAAIALHFFCTYPDARVVMTAPTGLQVDKIIWREIKRLKMRASIPIDGRMEELARTGLKAGLREIYGFTSKEATDVAGISGPNMIYIVDEATGVADKIFEAIEGNRAGGARVVMFSNPTTTDGEFAQAFREKKHLYHTIQVSSEESPNVHEGRIVIPGLATREWIEEKRLEWGEDSSTYKIRVKEEFVYREEGRCISLHNILQAVDRWEDCSTAGDLQLGLDIAGDSEGSDETVIAVRRGIKLIQIYRRRGMSIEAIIAFLEDTMDRYRQGSEQVTICIDREGKLGFEAWKHSLHWMRSLPSTRQPRVFGIRSSDKACRQPMVYDRVRDELWGNLADWMKEGAIPDDAKLQQELHCPSWRQLINGKMKAMSKDDMRKELGRSPDTADAVALSVWLPSNRDEQRADATENNERMVTERRFDPYSYGKTWVRK